MNEGYPPGGDAKAIAEIAKRRFGGYEPMFEHYGWPERGSDMMRKVQTRVAETFGSVREFEKHFIERNVGAFIDPPSMFAPISEWESFLDEMLSILPRYDNIEEQIASARDVIARKKRGEVV